jgi:hypothetical protein
MLTSQTAEAVAMAMLAVAAGQQDVQPGKSPVCARGSGVRYSKAQLKATLAMMGCKTRHAHKVCNPMPTEAGLANVW